MTGLRFEFRPLLVSGMLCHVPNGTLILIDSEQPEHEQNISVWHEIAHLLFEVARKPQPPEWQVELMAQSLAKVWPGLAAMLKDPHA